MSKFILLGIAVICLSALSYNVNALDSPAEHYNHQRRLQEENAEEQQQQGDQPVAAQPTETPQAPQLDENGNEIPASNESTSVTEEHIIDENGDVILTPDHPEDECDGEVCLPANAFNEVEAQRWAEETVEEAEERIAGEQSARRGKKPELIMLEPRIRAFSERNMPNQQPCGTPEKGKTHYLAEPGSRNYFQWRVLKASHNANCTVRFGTGLDESEFEVLRPRDGSADINGKFPCGRNAGYEGKEFRLPKGDVCSSCTVQFEWELDEGQIHQCADISLMDNNIAPECLGECQNGGVCVNGDCNCRRSFYGDYCEHTDTVQYAATWYLFAIAGIVGLTAGLAYAAYKLRQQQLKRAPKPAGDDFDQLQSNVN